MTPQINLLHLKYFCDAVAHNSMSEAAKINFVSQSAVSQAIAKLEVSLGSKIVVHSRQKFQVTEEGNIVFEQARHIFKSVDEIYELINLNSETVTGNLRFVSTNSLGMSFMAPVYKKMQVNHPQVHMNFKLGNLSFIRNALRQGDAEFAVVVYDQSFSQFSKHTLKKGKFHLYQSKKASHHLIKKGILVDSAEGMYVDALHDYFNQTNKSPVEIQAELGGWEVVARFTEMNIGVGLFPDYIIANNRYPNIKPYNLALPHFDYEICAIHNSGEKLSRAACAFIEQFSLGDNDE